MTEFFIGVATYLRGLGSAYLLLALLAVGLAVYLAKDRRRKFVSTTVVLVSVSVLPAYDWLKRREAEKARQEFAAEAWATFKKLCAEQSGEKIYKRFPGVKSVLVTKPLPPATERDLFDQYWYGDPYSSATALSTRGVNAAARLTVDSQASDGIRDGLDFVEIKVIENKEEKLLRIEKPSPQTRDSSRTEIKQPKSRFAVEWNDISTPELRRLWIAASNLQVIDTADGSVIAERRGFLIESGFGSRGGQRRPWLTARGARTTCPPINSGGYSDNWFIGSVFPKAN